MKKQERIRSTIPSNLLIKLMIIGIIVTTLLSGMSRSTNAQSAPATYTVVAGMSTQYGIDVLAYGPQTLKVHRGDTVVFQFMGFHDVHFDEKPLDFIVTSQIDGKTVTELNPALLMPGKSGQPHQHGMSSGVPMGGPGSEPTWSVVMDVAPGTYTYVCDIHPGMIGTLVVVDDKTQIPGPDEVAKAGKAELESALATAEKAYLDLLKKPAPTPKDGNLDVADYAIVGTVLIARFFPQVATIQVGQSVTWTVPKGITDPGGVIFPASGPNEPFAPLIDSKKQPHFALPAEFSANVKSGVEFPIDGIARSGILYAGQSFTLKFTKPGYYAYRGFSNDQLGMIVVQPPMPPQGGPPAAATAAK